MERPSRPRPRRSPRPARPTCRLRIEQRHGVVPKTDIDPDILTNRPNRAGATAATGGGASLKAAGDEIFLYLCGDASYVE
jgi:hypothetical protein